MRDVNMNAMSNTSSVGAASATRQSICVSASKRHVPFLLYGVLLFVMGLVGFLFGVSLSLPRILLAMPKLLLVQQEIIWFSGVPIVLGIAIALIDVLLFFDAKRFGAPVRMMPVANRGVTVALTAYNDEESIGPAVADFLQYPDVRRVIVVSNNSSDATYARAEAAGALTFNEMQPGYGRWFDAARVDRDRGMRLERSASAIDAFRFLSCRC